MVLCTRRLPTMIFTSSLVDIVCDLSLDARRMLPKSDPAIGISTPRPSPSPVPEPDSNDGQHVGNPGRSRNDALAEVKPTEVPASTRICANAIAKEHDATARATSILIARPQRSWMLAPSAIGQQTHTYHWGATMESPILPTLTLVRVLPLGLPDLSR